MEGGAEAGGEWIHAAFKDELLNPVETTYLKAHWEASKQEGGEDFPKRALDQKDRSESKDQDSHVGSSRRHSHRQARQEDRGENNAANSPGSPRAESNRRDYDERARSPPPKVEKHHEIDDEYDDEEFS